MPNLGDLNNLLFKQLQKLESSDEDKVDKELERTKGITDIARVLLLNANTVITAEKLRIEYGSHKVTSELLLTNEK